MPESFVWTILVVVAILFLGWFALGTQRNVRKGDVVLRWLKGGLPLVGDKSTMRWLGSSVLELKIAKAKSPFRTAETLAVFEPRDVVLLWLLERARGRRDTLIFRAQLQSAPAFELDAFDPRGWMTQHLESGAKKNHWKRLTLDGTSPLMAYFSGDAAAAAGKPLIELAGRAGGKLVRLSVRKSLPNLEVHWLLPDAEKYPARDLFLKLRQIGEDALKP
ncbi:MAG: hypothetical protein HY782_25140 [Chloroflexi bacterium]|nr:hypothetical protein [Chloroflexota bacterium]